MRAGVEIGPRLEQLGMYRPFAVTAAGTVELLAVEVDEDEIAVIEQLAQRDVMPLQPEAAAFGIAHRDMAEDAIAMAVQFEDAPGLGELVELLPEAGADHLDVAKLAHSYPPA